MSGFQQKQQNDKAYKKTGKYGSSQKIKNLIENISEEAHTLELLIKDIKSSVLNVFSELKKTMNKDLKEIRRNV